MTNGTDTLNNAMTTITKSIVLSWPIIIIISLTIVVIILSWLLIRREKALQLMGFSISALGLKLTYELNKDEKLRTLALENIALQNEVKGLETKNSRERWRSFGLIMLVFLILILDKFKLRHIDKTEDTKLIDTPKDDEQK